MRFKEAQYSILDNTINSIVPDSIDLSQWIKSGVKTICVVLDSEENNRIIHFSGSSDEKKSEIKSTFNNLYNQIVDLTKDKLTILKSLYNHVSGDEALVITNKRISNDFLFDTLEESNGYLIYHHQLEYFLITQMGFDETEAIELRKSWNKKVAIEKEKINSNENFYKLDGLMPFEFVLNRSN